MDDANPIIKQARESKETEIQLCITAAELSTKRGDHGDAEVQYLRALDLARQSWDRYDAKVGSILLELQDIYELQGRVEDAERMEQEVAGIFRRYFFRLLSRAVQYKSRNQ